MTKAVSCSARLESKSLSPRSKTSSSLARAQEAKRSTTESCRMYIFFGLYGQANSSTGTQWLQWLLRFFLWTVSENELYVATLLLLCAWVKLCVVSIWLASIRKQPSDYWLNMPVKIQNTDKYNRLNMQILIFFEYFIST